ncbi:hypothetical protein GCM10010256_74150 [Streptomyces coeruleorubidus]|nr:hypothetical protein GCM10010256_74150 [Streptomyces coeruleorubidus]
MPLRRFQESRTIALDVRTGLTPLLSLIAHTPACLLRSAGHKKRRLTPYEFQSKTEAASGQLVTAAGPSGSPVSCPRGTLLFTTGAGSIDPVLPVGTSTPPQPCATG